MLGRSCNLTVVLIFPSVSFLVQYVAMAVIWVNTIVDVDIINAIQAAPGAEELDRAMLEHWAV